MKRFLFALLLIVSVLAPVFAGTGPSTSITVTDAVFTTSDSLTSETAASGPSPASDGYYGSFSYNYNITGTGSFTYYVVMTTYYEDASGNWVYNDQTVIEMTANGGDQGTQVFDLFEAGAPAGINYAIYCQVCTGTIDTLIPLFSPLYTWSNGLPNQPAPSTPPTPPAASHGTLPTDPTTTPTSPTSGPAGPGTSFYIGTNYPIG